LKIQESFAGNTATEYTNCPQHISF